MRWIKNFFKTISLFLVNLFTVEVEIPEKNKESEYDTLTDYFFKDTDSDLLQSKMLRTFIDISKYLSSINSSKLVFGIKYFNVEDILYGSNIVRRLDEVKRSMCFTKVSILTNEETCEREFIVTVHIFNKTNEGKPIKITITSYLNSLSFTNKDRFKLLEASRMLVTGFIKAENLDSLTIYNNSINSFQETNEISSKEVNVSIKGYGQMGDFETPTLLQYINNLDKSQILDMVDVNLLYSTSYVVEEEMVFDIVRKEMN